MCKCFTFLLVIPLYVHLAYFDVVSGVYMIYIVHKQYMKYGWPKSQLPKRYFLALNLMPIQTYAIHCRKRLQIPTI